VVRARGHNPNPNAAFGLTISVICANVD